MSLKAAVDSERRTGVTVQDKGLAIARARHVQAAGRRATRARGGVGGEKAHG